MSALVQALTKHNILTKQACEDVLHLISQGVTDTHTPAIPATHHQQNNAPVVLLVPLAVLVPLAPLVQPARAQGTQKEAEMKQLRIDNLLMCTSRTDQTGQIPMMIRSIGYICCIISS